MASLKDIAKRAELSINTVSRAIRGIGYVSEDARKKVMRIAVELGYRPNRAARSLRFRKNFEIAVISFLGTNNRSGDQLMMEKFVGIKRRLAASGYEMNLHFLDIDNDSELANLKILEDITGQSPAGIIIIGDSELYKSIYRLMEAKKIPAVLISYDVIPEAARFNPPINTTATSGFPALKQAKLTSSHATPHQTYCSDRKSSKARAVSKIHGA